MPVLKDPREEKFAQGVAMGLRKGEAYRKAGFKNSSSKHAFEVNVTRMLKKFHIRARIAELVAKAATKAEVTVERIIHELALIGFANMQDYIGPDGQPLPTSQLTRD